MSYGTQMEQNSFNNLFDSDDLFTVYKGERNRIKDDETVKLTCQWSQITIIIIIINRFKFIIINHVKCWSNKV